MITSILLRLLLFMLKVSMTVMIILRSLILLLSLILRLSIMLMLRSSYTPAYVKVFLFFCLVSVSYFFAFL